MDSPMLHYFFDRGPGCSKEDVLRALVEEVKDFVFDGSSIVLRSEGNNGLNMVLRGEVPLSDRRDDLWKLIDIFFSLTRRFDNSVFSISTKVADDNLFYRECERNDLIPSWIQSKNDFVSRLFVHQGIVHLVLPEVEQKFRSISKKEIVRSHAQLTRDILITEAVRQRIYVTGVRNFGMQMVGVRLPLDLAYVARGRPDLLSAAIREFITVEKTANVKKYEDRMRSSDLVMVHVRMNSKDWKYVTSVADIEKPNDIVSYRVSLAMLMFDEKYVAVPNGFSDDAPNSTFSDVKDTFERERLNSLFHFALGKPHSLAHRYQTAKALVTSAHIAECRRILIDGSTTSSDRNDSADDEVKKDHLKSQKRIKKRHKRTLAAVQTKEILAPTPDDDEPHPSSSNQLRHFERAVNGEDVYEASSDEGPLCEDEDTDWLAAIPSSKKNKTAEPAVTKKNRHHAKRRNSVEDDDDVGFDLRELIDAMPPLASQDMEDFDDI